MCVVGLVWMLILCSVEGRGSVITELPGFEGRLPSKQYGGYITIDGDKNLYYYFVTSQTNPHSDPLVLWLNGGPGCSSFDGFVYEHGLIIIPLLFDIRFYYLLIASS